MRDVALANYGRDAVVLGAAKEFTLNQSAIFVGVVVGFLDVFIIRLWSLRLAVAISSLI